ncbi:MAG: AsmA-like C-terminal region-containing protein [Bacteroidia bacterium]
MNQQPKKSHVKRILKWTGITFLVLIILIISAPFLFKNKIVQLVKDEADKNLNALVDFGDFDLTLFSSFPDFKFTINNVSVVGVNEFKNDTLAYIGQLSINLNIKSVISGDKYEVNSISIDKARIQAKVMADGKANWDITKPSADTSKAVPSQPSKFNLQLKDLKISSTFIEYDDKKGDMYARLEDFNYDLKGDFTQDEFVMSNLLEIGKTTYKMSGVSYLKNVHTKVKADLDMNMPKMNFTFKENEFSLNDLTLGLDGFVAMPDTNINMDLKFKANQTEFKALLSLIPAVYSKDFANVQTAGKLALNGNAKGTYNKAQYPAFGLELVISDAMFKYPSLPKSVNNINIDVKVQNPTGVLDATTIDVNKFHVEMAGNPINLWAHVKTPISDPDLSAEVKGVIQLASVKEFIPLEAGDEMNGTIKADISVAGRMSSVEKKQYENFKASGALEVDNMKYKTSTLAYDVTVNTMKLNFTNQFVELTTFDALLGKSDIKAAGKIENFMQYVFKDDLIKGAFDVSGHLIDVNQLMASPASTTAPATTTAAAASGTTASSVAEVPGNIDFVLNAKFAKVLYDNLTIDNMNGNIVIRDKKLDMTNLNMNMLGGSVMVNGSYETTDPKKPGVALNLKVENWDIQTTFNTFNTMKKLAPIGQYAKGVFSATLENFKTTLDDKMNPDLNAVHANGVFKTNKVSVGGFAPFVKLGEALKIEQLKNLSFDNLNLSYEITNGRIVLKPFDVKIDQVNANISGSTGLDQTIDYKWKMQIPRAMFGKEANSVLEGLMGKANAAAGTDIKMGDKINVTANIGGTVTDPKIKTGLKDDAKSTVENVKDQAVAVVADKANEEAQKILDDAKAQVDKIKAETQALADKTKQEGYAQADALVEQASNPIAKIAAKKSAEIAKKEIDKKVQKIVDDSDARCQKILDDAKVKADEKANAAKK